jgi:hypothetical protein
MLARLLAAAVVAMLAAPSVVSASSMDVYTVAFTRPLNEAFAADVAALLGYTCTMPAPAGGATLLLALNTTSLATLHAELGSCVGSVTRLPIAARLAPTLARYGYDGEFDAPAELGVARSLDDSSSSTGNAPVDDSSSSTSVPTHTDLQLFVHDGALDATTTTTTLESVRASVAAALVALVANGSSTHAVTAVEPTLIVVASVARNSLRALAEALVAAVPVVCYAAPVYPARLTNLWLTSTLELMPPTISSTSVSAADACTDAICRPLAAAGLRGTGQLLALADTGVATGACFFRDATAAVPFTSSMSVVPADTGHAVVRAYSSGTGGDYVDANGHGSHCAGTALGRPTADAPVDTPSRLEPADFTGVAPGARLVVVDMQVGASGALVVPTPLDTKLFAFMYAAGARVCSCSWGYSSFVYSPEDRQADAFAHTHRDFLIVFAAGNAGAERGPGSVLSPALAKNVFAVGAAMNGYAAAALAVGASPTEPADAYAPDWVADFSSRGGGGVVSWLKPDALAPGGAYTWSAASTGGTCAAPIASLVAGRIGTSMAAPGAAGIALVAREYLLTGFYYSIVVAPRASLLRALLIASATPMRGVFPSRPLALFDDSSSYAPYGGGYVGGYGHVAAARVLPLTSASPSVLGVLANEHTAALASTGSFHRYCVAVRAPGGDAPSAALDFVVALVFADPPSTPSSSGTAALVNDLDVRVYVDGESSTTPLTPNGLTTRDSGSTSERVVGTSTTGRLRIDVVAASLGLGSQDYSLVLVAFVPGGSIAVGGVELATTTSLDDVRYTTTAGACTACAGTGTYQVDCPTCGNGVVDAGEECEYSADFSPCCSPTTCTRITDARACARTVTDADCFLVGECRSPEAPACYVDMFDGGSTMMYGRSPTTGECVPLATTAPPSPPTPPPPPPLCSRSVDGALRGLAHATSTDVICCASHTAIAAAYVDGASGPRDVSFARLARHVVAATENIRRGVAASGLTLARVADARALLAAHCTTGFVTDAARDARAQAHSLIDVLALFNAGTCSGDNDDDAAHAPATCIDERERASREYCGADAASTFDGDTDGVCRCASRFHPNARACNALHCNGYGASVPHTSTPGEYTCSCLPGWAGSACTTCASPPSSAVAYLCVGLVRARVPAALDRGESRVLVLVDATSVASRLGGSYYAATEVKAPDVRPGTSGVSCACQDAATAIDYRTYTSHADALAAARDAYTRHAALAALALPTSRAAASVAPPSPPPPSSTAASSSRHRRLVVAVVVATTTVMLLLL